MLVCRLLPLVYKIPGRASDSWFKNLECPATWGLEGDLQPFHYVSSLWMSLFPYLKLSLCCLPTWNLMRFKEWWIITPTRKCWGTKTGWTWLKANSGDYCLLNVNHLMGKSKAVTCLVGRHLTGSQEDCLTSGQPHIGTRGWASLWVYPRSSFDWGGICLELRVS